MLGSNLFVFDDLFDKGPRLELDATRGTNNPTTSSLEPMGNGWNLGWHRVTRQGKPGHIEQR